LTPEDLTALIQQIPSEVWDTVEQIEQFSANGLFLLMRECIEFLNKSDSKYLTLSTIWSFFIFNIKELLESNQLLTFHLRKFASAKQTEIFFENLQNHKVKLGELTLQVRNVEDNIEQLSNEHTKLIQKINDQQITLNTVKHSISQLNQELFNTKRLTEQNNEQLSENQRLRDQLTNRLEFLRNERLKLRQQRITGDQRVAELQQQIGKHSAELRVIISTQQQLQRVFAHEENKHFNLKSDLSKAETEIADYERQLVSLQNQKERQSDEIRKSTSKCKSEIRKQIIIMQMMQNQQQNYNTQMDKLNETKQQLNDAIDLLSASNNQFHVTETEMDEIDQLLKREELIIQQISHQIEQCQAFSQEIVDQRSALSLTHHSLLSQLNDEKQNLSKAQMTLQSENVRSSQLSASIEDANSLIVHLSRQITDAEQMLNDTQMLSNVKMNERSQIHSQLEQFNQQLTTLQNEKEQKFAHQNRLIEDAESKLLNEKERIRQMQTESKLTIEKIEKLIEGKKMAEMQFNQLINEKEHLQQIQHRTNAELKYEQQTLGEMKQKCEETSKELIGKHKILEKIQNSHQNQLSEIEKECDEINEKLSTLVDQQNLHSAKIKDLIIKHSQFQLQHSTAIDEFEEKNATEYNEIQDRSHLQRGQISLQQSKLNQLQVQLGELKQLNSQKKVQTKSFEEERNKRKEELQIVKEQREQQINQNESIIQNIRLLTDKGFQLQNSYQKLVENYKIQIQNNLSLFQTFEFMKHSTNNLKENIGRMERQTKQQDNQKYEFISRSIQTDNYTSDQSIQTIGVNA